MASFLRQIVAGPRAKHQETGLDLCYVTSDIIATSGPSQTYPQLAYRNPLSRLVAYLDTRHGRDWAIWEFRAEGTGYPDSAVYHRIRHFPWPDHHPPPFGLVPGIVGGMRNWLAGGGLDHESGGTTAGDKGGDNKGVDKSGGDKVGGDGKRVVVVHCKAGKGRSGTMACSFLIAERGWKVEDALARFTERRMRPGFGAGVSIPSQLRWVGYVDRWTRGGKRYVERPVEIVEVHVWGLRNGVKVAVEGFVEEGRKIRVFHTFKGEERIVVEPGAPGGAGMMDMVQDMAGYGPTVVVDGTGEVVEDADIGEATGQPNGENGSGEHIAISRASSKSKKTKGQRTTELARKLTGRKSGSSQSLKKLASDSARDSSRGRTIAMPAGLQTPSSGASLPGKEEYRSQSATNLAGGFSFADPSEPGGQAVIFKPSSPLVLPNSDINIAVERRNRGPASMGLTMVTAVAHVWFNTFFEGNGPEQDGKADESGVFEIDWDKMDGIKGSSQRGTRALDRVSVIWRVPSAGAAGAEGGMAASGVVINEPSVDSPVPQVQPADWKGGNAEDPAAEKHLGLRVEDPESRGVSKASSIKSEELEISSSAAKEEEGGSDRASLAGVKVSGPTGEEVLDERPGPPSDVKKERP